MKKFRFEIQITILSLIIGSIVITAGFFAYKSMSKIVKMIHQEAIPKHELFLIKDLEADLTMMESNVRLKILEGQNMNITPYYEELKSDIQKKIERIKTLDTQNEEYKYILDSIGNLATRKILIWENIINIHQSFESTKPEFKKLYKKIEESKLDTVHQKTEQKGFFRRLFGPKEEIDTVVVVRTYNTNEIKAEIAALEQDVQQKALYLDSLESKLISDNLDVIKKMSFLIDWAEQLEANKIIEKTNVVDELTKQTYKRIAIFIGFAVLLLTLVLFMILGYLKKSKEFQEALRDAKQKAEELANAKETFASNVSHELRTPINAIYGLSRQLSDNTNTEDKGKIIKALLDTSDYLRRIVNNILDISKIQKKKLVLSNIDFSPLALIEEVLTIVKDEAKSKGLALNWDWSGPTPKAVKGDPFRIKQILINLINNAVKFTERGSVGIHVTVLQKDDKVHFTFEVKDTGVGIPMSDQELIFTEFGQSQIHQNQGSGLGLSIVRDLVELLNGKIELRSQVGEGTTVKLKFVLEQGMADNLNSDESATEILPDHLRNLKFLIVDDSKYNRMILKGILKKWSVYYEECNQGKKAIEIIKEKAFDVILMDLRMPGMDGITSTKKILSIQSDSLIIGLTAGEKEREVMACMEAGMKDLLIKPFAENELIEIIDKNYKAQNKRTLDFQKFKKQIGGNEQFFTEMLTAFIETTEKEIRISIEAFKENNHSNLREAMHRMAPPCKHLDLMDVYHQIKHIEEKAKEKVDIKVIGDEINVLLSELRSILLKIKKYLKNHE